MKISEIIKNVDNREENSEYVDCEKFIREFNLGYYDYIEQNRLTCYWAWKWCCTDTWVGGRVYFLDDKPVCVSVQNSRKGDEIFYWINMDCAKIVKDYITSLIKENDEINVLFLDLDEDMGDGYQIAYNTQVTSWKNITLDGENVEFLERVLEEPDYGIDTMVKIKKKDNVETKVNIRDLRFPYSLYK